MEITVHIWMEFSPELSQVVLLGCRHLMDRVQVSCHLSPLEFSGLHIIAAVVIYDMSSTSQALKVYGDFPCL